LITTMTTVTHQSELEQLRDRVRQLESRNAVLEQRAELDHARLAALMQSATAFMLTRDLESLIELITRQAAGLVPGVQRALVWLRDDQADRLVLRRADGSRSTRLMLRLGEGIAGRACLAPRPMMFSGDQLAEAIADHDAADRRALEELLGDSWPPTSAIAAPLRIEHEPLGALVLLDGRGSQPLPAGDLLFVQSLAGLASSALAAARQEARVTQLDRDLSTSQALHAATRQQLDATEAGLLQTAKLAAVGQLAASVAHEINNPLYAVRNSLFLVEQDLAPDAPQHEFLTLAQNELGRIARIIARMRDFYKPAHSDFQPTDLNALIHETLYLAATYLEHAGIHVEATLDPTLPTLIASADQIRQVLLNLVLNACDAMPGGGTLTVSSKAEDGDVTIAVCDTGIGMPAEVHERLFEPFFTTKASGTGLGLSVSYHIVVQHGGALQIDSAPGAGTRCYVRLPLRYEPRQDAELAGYAAPRIGG
jgi:two-component system, NtrC family, sensor kinase